MIEVPAEPERRRTSVEWPTIVDDRLRLLVDLARQAEHLDGTSSANELLAALVCAQSLDTEHVAQLVNRYRNLSLDQIAAATQRRGGAAAPRRGRPRTAQRRAAEEG